MGTVKNELIRFLNKKHYFMIKTYSYYRADIWGFLRLKRLYKYKKIIYSIMRHKAKFHGVMLYKVYHGIKFFNKEFGYFSNLIFTKKRLKFFYGLLRDKYIGKLGRLALGGKRRAIDFFYSLLERRIDVLLYRSFFSITVRQARSYVLNKLVFINNILVKYYGCFLLVGDILQVNLQPCHPFFFVYAKVKSFVHFRKRYFLYYTLRRRFLKWPFFHHMKEKFFFFFFKNVPRGRKYIKKVVVMFRKFGRRLFIFGLLLLKKFRKEFFFKRRLVWQRLRKRHFFNKWKNKFYFYHIDYVLLKEYFIFIKKCVRLIRYLYKVIRWARRVFGFRNNKYKRKTRMIVYNFYTLKYRFRRFFFFLRPKKLMRFKYKWIFRRRLVYKYHKFGRFIRYWSFSRNVFEYLKNSKFFFFVFAGYFAYMEINYKIFIVLLIRDPKVSNILYPFNVNKFVYFSYFKRRGYF
jgi:ribosomal protein S4